MQTTIDTLFVNSGNLFKTDEAVGTLLLLQHCLQLLRLPRDSFFIHILGDLELHGKVSVGSPHLFHLLFEFQDLRISRTQLHLQLLHLILLDIQLDLLALNSDVFFF